MKVGATLFLALLGAGCGGGNEHTEGAVKLAGPMRATSVAMTTQAAAAGVTADMTLNWAEYSFPDQFPKALGVRFPAIVYEGTIYNARLYAGVWGERYLGITSEGQVFGLGDFTGGALQQFNDIEHWAPLVLADQCNVSPESCLIPLFDVRVIDNAALRAVGDFSGDRRLDLIAEVRGVSSFVEPKTYIYRQDNNGQFTKIALSFRLSSPSASEADFNLDGRDDLVIQESCALAVKFFSPDLLSTTSTTELAPGTCADSSVHALDFDGDGKTDLLPLGSSPMVAFLGTGTQTFKPLQVQKPSALQGRMLAAADLDGDGKVDLLAANSAHGANQVSISVAYGAGSGNYTNVKNWVYPNLTQGYSIPSGPAFVADFNKDGFKDVLYCPGGGGSCQLIVGDGRQSFGVTPELVSLNAGGVAVVDVNGDGNVDVVVSTFSDGIQMRLGNGKGKFSAAVTVPGSVGSFSSPSEFRIADLNGDGKLDIVLTIDGVLKVFSQR